jgi:hypothetical protein
MSPPPLSLLFRFLLLPLPFFFSFFPLSPRCTIAPASVAGTIPRERKPPPRRKTHKKVSRTSRTCLRAAAFLRTWGRSGVTDRDTPRPRFARTRSAGRMEQQATDRFRRGRLTLFLTNFDSGDSYFPGTVIRPGVRLLPNFARWPAWQTPRVGQYQREREREEKTDDKFRCCEHSGSDPSALGGPMQSYPGVNPDKTGIQSPLSRSAK